VDFDACFYSFDSGLKLHFFHGMNHGGLIFSKQLSESSYQNVFSQLYLAFYLLFPLGSDFPWITFQEMEKSLGSYQRVVENRLILDEHECHQHSILI
jgi:hypothetical protein